MVTDGRLALMVHLQRRGIGVVMREGAERHVAAAGRAYEDVPEAVRVLPELRVDLEHDVVLVQLRVHRRHEPLAERVVQRVVDHLRRDAEPRRRLPIDRERGLEPMRLLVAVDVDELGERPQLVVHLRRPVVERLDVVALQRVLVLRVRSAAADPQILIGLEIQRGAGNPCQLPAEPGHHLIDGQLPLAQILQVDVHARVVQRGPAVAGAAAAHEGDHGVDGRILL